MWGSAATEPPGGGFGSLVPPPAENFAILGTENHVLMHFRTTFWGYNVDYLLCLVTLQLNINNKKKKKKKKKKNHFFFLFFFIFKNVKIRGNPRIRGEISCLILFWGIKIWDNVWPTLLPSSLPIKNHRAADCRGFSDSRHISLVILFGNNFDVNRDIFLCKQISITILETCFWNLV